MWTSTLELSPRRVMMTRALGWLWRDAYFSSFAPLQVQNVPREQLPARDWVRVRNRLAGICGSDLHLVYADGDFRVAPAALPGHKRSFPGHEVVGEVIEVGEDVTLVQVGDRVTLQYGQCCATTGTLPMCRSCAMGNYNLCEQAQFAGPGPIGGGWSEEMLVHEQQVFRVPPALSDEQAVLLEPSAVAVHSVLRHLPGPDEHVLVMGAGTIGLLVLQAIRALAPQTKVSVMARYPFQVEQATRMGAASILYPRDSYDSVVQATGARLYTGMMGNKMLLGGYDAIYDTIGTQDTLADALRWTRAGGAIVLVGVDLNLKYLDLSPVWYQEVNVLGSMGHGMENWPIGTRQRRSTFAVAAELIEQRLLYPEKLLTHRFALTNFREAIRAASKKGETRAIKVVFDYALLPASVVPNVRSAARQRRPARVTTATWPEQEQAEEQVAGVPALDEQPQAQPEAENELEERSWFQYVQPYPTVTPEPVEPVGVPEPEEEYAPAPPLTTDEVEPAPYVTEDAPPAIFYMTGEGARAEEDASPAMPYMTGEGEDAMQVEEMPQEPMDETMMFYAYEEVGAPPPEKQEVPEDEVTTRMWVQDVKEQEEFEPQPLVFADDEQSDTTGEGESETEKKEAVKPPRPGAGRRRSKSSGRKTEGHGDATKDASETL
ncbi:MAG TPA: alcohol dehydrogenase catalytic domain-containing protein [Ktedonobacteraceae bacterium]|nr:alcohol dehydrogenase catalytic domain-containing protein [Ktedonobacteraceae bacterium]